MSYILEALRKSEIERKQGEVPSLGSSVQMIHKPGTTKGPWLLWGLLIALVLNGVLLAWLFWPQAAPPVTSNPAAPVATQPLTPTSPDANERVSAPGNTAPRGQDSSGGAVASASAVSSASAGSSAGDSTRMEDFAVPIEPVPVKSGAQRALSANTTSAAVSDEAVAAPNDDQVQGKYQQNQAQEVAVEPASAEADAPGGADEAPYNQDGPAAPTLGEMPAAFQRRVPDLVFNSHIFSSRPDARRVMINNEYLREGARFGDMMVEEITEDGVILSLGEETFTVSVVRNWNRPR